MSSLTPQESLRKGNRGEPARKERVLPFADAPNIGKSGNHTLNVNAFTN